MLEIKNITKVYKTEGFTQTALDSVSVNFRECEFASILGPSGSGKTTFLNIIGGLDHYTSGDLIINEISTKMFKDSDWDSYRNHRIGFVFQNYNLISHQTILANVKLALTLSGISKKEANERAKQALIEVGLEKHMHKRPSQLSGGQMQRVAIARALVNNPDILLADEPTGALDSTTSIQIMELLKKISQKKLVIMVTHNPELAKEYSNRIINLKDGKIISDTNPYDGRVNTHEQTEVNKQKQKKTSMSFLTALSLSFNNLMTKKGRTILVAFAGSIGIIGIALILAVSTGFQNYVDSIQEETLTSYPLTIMQESTDIVSTLLEMQTKKGDGDTNNDKVVEQQYITSMLSSISKNDLKSFKKYIEKNYNKISTDVSTISYSYSIDPLIYTIDSTNKLSKVNPSNLFSTIYSSNMVTAMSGMGSVYSKMLDNQDTLNEQYDIIKGRWPEKYDELVIVLSERNTISDLLVYSLGLRNPKELSEMIQKIMSGEKSDVKNEPMTLTYDDLLNVELKLIEQPKIYRYNTNYSVYENMSEDEEYMKEIYESATRLKIVGIVVAKEGLSSTALSPGVNYRSDLIDHIIDYSSNSEVVKKQLENEEIDVFSNKRFDSEKNEFDFGFSDLVSVDEKKLSEAFNIKIDENALSSQTEKYMTEIVNSITTNITPAKEEFMSNFNTLANGLFTSLTESFNINDVNNIVDTYMNAYEPSNIVKSLEEKYTIPADYFKQSYSGMLKGLVSFYIMNYIAVDPTLSTDPTSPTAIVNNDILSQTLEAYTQMPEIVGVAETMAKPMTEAKMKMDVVKKVGELTANLTNTFAQAFNINPDAITSAFQLNFTEDELMRVMSAMLNRKETTLKSNLVSLGYQDKEDPTMISIYFSSFDGKENFLKFIDNYNKIVESEGHEEKTIRYSDTTGILMGSVKTIVNAVSYVLIAFVSISLVVSSIMIGIITYISVYERTKEIGILRSIGASKRNISSIFNAETFIIGLLSGLFGIGISYSLIPIINKVLHAFTGNIPLSAALETSSATKLVILSIILTLIGGLIPAKAASKKDPVEALRSE